MMNSQILSVRERLGLPKGMGRWVLGMKGRTVATLLGFCQLNEYFEMPSVGLCSTESI
jgi:hypothetical protein